MSGMQTTANHRVATERVAACPLCTGTSSELLCRSGDRKHALSDQTFPYSRCRRCQAIYQSERPREADIGVFYPAEYGPYQGAVVRGDEPHALQGPHRTFRSRAGRRMLAAAMPWIARLNESINRRFPDPLPAILKDLYTPRRSDGTLLDFGCGSSAFLDVCWHDGWITLGVDFHPDVVETVIRAGHRALLVNDELWRQIPDASIDVIRMNHVIEHLYQPADVMAQLRRKLRPGGRLHLATPNADSWVFRVLRQCWHPLEAPRHIVIYSPRIARRLLLAAGFASVRCFQEVLTKDTARSVGYWLWDRGKLDGAGALDMMNWPQLAACLFPLARLAARVGASDRFHAIAHAD